MERVIDPVCGVELEPVQAFGSSFYKDEEFFFCSAGCREVFEEDPLTYALARLQHTSDLISRQGVAELAASE